MKQDKPSGKRLPGPRDFFENLDLKRKKKANKPRRGKNSKQEDLSQCNYLCEKVCSLQRKLEEKNRNRDKQYVF